MTRSEGVVTGVTWEVPHPTTGERIVVVTANSTAEVGPLIKDLLEQEPAPGADDLRKVTWDVAQIYGISGGYMSVSGHLPGIGSHVVAAFRIIITPFDIGFRKEDGKRVNDAAMILHMMGLGDASQLARRFGYHCLERTYVLLRGEII